MEMIKCQLTGLILAKYLIQEKIEKYLDFLGVNLNYIFIFCAFIKGLFIYLFNSCHINKEYCILINKKKKKREHDGK